MDGLAWVHDIVTDPNGGDDNNLLRGVGYGDGLFIAVGGGGKGQSMTTRDGETRENERHDERAFLSDVAFPRWPLRRGRRQWPPPPIHRWRRHVGG